MMHMHWHGPNAQHMAHVNDADEPLQQGPRQRPLKLRLSPAGVQRKLAYVRLVEEVLRRARRLTVSAKISVRISVTYTDAMPIVSHAAGIGSGV